MNPFTESTVARPLAELPVFDRPRGQAGTAPPQAAKAPRPRNKRSAVPRPATPPTARFASLRVPCGRSAARHERAKPALRVGRLAASVAVFAALMLPGVVTALDVNLATQEQLQGVRGIGPKTAQIIIEERQRGGRFESFDDLSDRVKGIGPRKAAALQASGLTVDAAGSRAPAVSTAPAGKAPAVRAAEPAGSGRTSAKPAGGLQKARPDR